MSDPCAHGDRRSTCGACLQSYCATCQRPACPHPAQEIEPAPPLAEEEIERLRREHIEERIRGESFCASEDHAGWPCLFIRLADALDQERALRQTAETALAEERQKRERAEYDCAAWKGAAAERSEIIRARTVSLTRLVEERDRARAALVACEARLAEANQKIEDVLDDAWHWQKRAMMAEQVWAYYESEAQPAPLTAEEAPKTLVCTRKHCPLCTPPATPVARAEEE